MADFKVVDIEPLEANLKGMADEVRTLADTDNNMSLEAMAENVAQANETVDAQSVLISQIKTALQGKAISGKEEQTKSIDITENGNYSLFPDEGYTLSGVDVNVDVKENFIGVKYFNFDKSRNIPKTADARSLDLLLINGGNALEHCLTSLFRNTNTNGNGGFFVYLEEVYLPSNAIAMSDTFVNCANLRNIYGDLSKIKSLNSAFQFCYSLENVPYMPNLDTIWGSAFQGCRSLIKYYVPPKVTSIYRSAFSDCSNLLDIYVAFGEGEVANAPWGATNATLHYNTQYDENGNPIIEEV